MIIVTDGGCDDGVRRWSIKTRDDYGRPHWEDEVHYGDQHTTILDVVHHKYVTERRVHLQERQDFRWGENRSKWWMQELNTELQLQRKPARGVIVHCVHRIFHESDTFADISCYIVQHRFSLP